MSTIIEDPITIERSFDSHKARITSIAFNPCPSELAVTRKRRSSMQQIQVASATSGGELTLWNYSPCNQPATVFRSV
jgi:WD40 repeat protein